MELPALRVLFLDHVAAMSGGEIALIRLIDSLPHVRPTVVLGEDGPLRSALEQQGVPVQILPVGTTGTLRRADVSGPRAVIGAAWAAGLYVLRLRWVISRLHPDVVHANSLKSGFYGCLAARLARTPSVWHVRDRIAGDYLPPFAVRLTRLALWFLPKAIVANSMTTARTIAGPFRHAAYAIVLHDPYAPQKAPSAAHSLRTPERTVAMVGRLAPWKGQDVFLRAFAEAFPSGAIRCRIIGAPLFGEEDYEVRIRDLAEQLGLVGRVEFRGFRADIEAELSEVDLLVHASTVAEPFGQVVVEGMAAGLPVIASAAGGPGEIITDDVNGLLVPPNDPTALARAMSRVMGDDELRARLGASARQRARSFLPEAVGPKMERLYRRLVSSGRMHPSR